MPDIPPCEREWSATELDVRAGRDARELREQAAALRAQAEQIGRRYNLA